MPPPLPPAGRALTWAAGGSSIFMARGRGVREGRNGAVATGPVPTARSLRRCLGTETARVGPGQRPPPRSAPPPCSHSAAAGARGGGSFPGSGGGGRAGNLAFPRRFRGPRRAAGPPPGLPPLTGSRILVRPHLSPLPALRVYLCISY